MKIRFETSEHKFQIKATLDQILSNKEFKMTQKDAKMFGEIMKRLTSTKLEDKWKKNQVDVLASIIHQVLSHREVTSEEFLKGKSEEEKQLYSIQNNIYLIVLDNLKSKLGYHENSQI